MADLEDPESDLKLMTINNTRDFQPVVAPEKVLGDQEPNVRVVVH